MSSKVCSKCGEEKSFHEFYKDKSRPDGLRADCKMCFRKYDHKRGQTEYRKSQNRKNERGWYKKNPDKARAKKMRYPERYKARVALRYAVRKGRITRPVVCSVCGKHGPTEGHHNDYSKPLDIRWVCHSCHRKIHTEIGCIA